MVPYIPVWIHFQANRGITNKKLVNVDGIWYVNLWLDAD